MDEVIRAIEATDAENIQDLLDVAVRRYKELFPEWKVVFYSAKREQFEEEDNVVADLLRIAYRLGGGKNL